LSTFWALLLLLTILVSASALAQSPALEEPWEDLMDGSDSDADSAASVSAMPGLVVAPSWHDAVTNLPGDWVRAGAEPLRVEAVPALIGIGAITGGLVLIDHPAYEMSRRLYRSSRTSRRIIEGIRFLGDGRAVLGVAGSFALFGALTGNRRALSTASHTAEALLASGVAVQVLKRVAGRESPQMSSRNSGCWRPFPKWSSYNRAQARYYAFPSGHVTTTMAMVTVLANDYPEVTWIRPAGYALTGLVGVSLVSTGWHWYSDFPLACALGYVFGNLATSHRARFSTMDQEENHTSLDVRPVVSWHSTGLGLVYSF
jgi:membrane-associated phospholipid phosphatase